MILPRTVLFLLLFTILFTKGGLAQIFPAEGDVLNYRLAGFTITKDTKAEKYIFEVSGYDLHEDGSLTETWAAKQASDSNKTIIMLPSFAKAYRWRVTTEDKKGKKLSTTDYINFTTGRYPTVDTSKYRLRIIDSATHHHDLFVITDNSFVIYDLDGNPVWYLPDVPLKAGKDIEMRCIKPTQDGTFTAVGDLEAFEFDYHGKVLWKAPNDGKVNGSDRENYHHEMVKLKNGNYMVAGLGFSMEKIPENLNSNMRMIDSGKMKRKEDGYYRRIKTDNLIEYNSKKEVVWTWRALEHFDRSEFFKVREHGVNIDMHLNSFFFDEENKVIYATFRNTDEMIKIAYPSGEILARYGAIWLNDTLTAEQRLFHGQHCVVVGPDKRLYLYDNNTTRSHPKSPSYNNTISHVSIFSETASKTGLREDWDFSCDIDSQTAWFNGSGGSVYVLDDGCILTGMGDASRAFIVTPEKKIAWNAIAENGDGNNVWFLLKPYRVNYITRKELESFIFKSHQ